MSQTVTDHHPPIWWPDRVGGVGTLCQQGDPGGDTEEVVPFTVRRVF